MFEIVGQIVVGLVLLAMILVILATVFETFDRWLNIFRLNWFARRAGDPDRLNPWSWIAVRVAWHGVWKGARFKGTDRRGKWAWSIPGRFTDRRIRKLERWEY